MEGLVGPQGFKTPDQGIMSEPPAVLPEALTVCKELARQTYRNLRRHTQAYPATAPVKPLLHRARVRGYPCTGSRITNGFVELLVGVCVVWLAISDKRPTDPNSFIVLQRTSSDNIRLKGKFTLVR